MRTILWAASQRGERGIAGLRLGQLQVRPDCMLCRRPFSEKERAAASPTGSRSAPRLPRTRCGQHPALGVVPVVTDLRGGRPLLHEGSHHRDHPQDRLVGREVIGEPRHGSDRHPCIAAERGWAEPA